MEQRKGAQGGEKILCFTQGDGRSEDWRFPLLFPGGRQSKYAVNAFEVFDTDTRSWAKFPNIPNKRAFSSFVPTEDKLFSLGGLRQGRLYRQPKFMRTVDVFDLEQGGGWPCPSLPEGFGGTRGWDWGLEPHRAGFGVWDLRFGDTQGWIWGLGPHRAGFGIWGLRTHRAGFGALLALQSSELPSAAALSSA